MVSIQIYDFFERKTKLRVNKFIKENTVVKKCVPIPEVPRLIAHLGLSHVFILVLILRLRQLCCHPYLTLVTHPFILHNYFNIYEPFLQSLTEAFDDPGMLVASGAEKELSRAKKIMGVSWVNQVNDSVLLLFSSELNT